MILCQQQMKVFTCGFSMFWNRIFPFDWFFEGHPKHENVDKNEKIRQKVSKLSISQEEFAGKLLKTVSKKLDEIQAADRDLTMVRNT